MCVAIVKPAGIKMPSERMLKMCCESNPHGFGFYTPTRYFRTMDANRFIEEAISVSKDEPCILHARFATCGSRKVSNCHPFYDLPNSVAFCHNGCLPLNPKEDITDSEYAFRQIFLPVIEKYGYGSPEMDETVRRIIGGSRFAFMKDGEIRTYGPFVRLDGLLFSNLNFMRW